MVRWVIVCVGRWMVGWSDQELGGWMFMWVGRQTVLKGGWMFIMDEWMFRWRRIYGKGIFQ